MKRNLACIAALRVAFLPSLARDAKPGDVKPDTPSGRLVLAHYLPWHEARPTSPTWGWHWTMNAFNPDQRPGLLSRSSNPTVDVPRECSQGRDRRAPPRTCAAVGGADVFADGPRQNNGGNPIILRQVDNWPR
jgi:hypothetical protein